jgi:hypothetical protein
MIRGLAITAVFIGFTILSGCNRDPTSNGGDSLPDKLTMLKDLEGKSVGNGYSTTWRFERSSSVWTISKFDVLESHQFEQETEINVHMVGVHVNPYVGPEDARTCYDLNLKLAYRNDANGVLVFRGVSGGSDMKEIPITDQSCQGSIA